jgi:hypothetical protein
LASRRAEEISRLANSMRLEGVLSRPVKTSSMV